MSKTTTRVTDWLWYDECPICEAVAGDACLDQRVRLTATIQGQGPLHRPHKERPKLAARLIPFLSDEARAAIPEILSVLDSHSAKWTTLGPRTIEGSTKAPENLAHLRYVAWLLKKAATAVPTTRADPTWPDGDSSRK